MWCITYRGLQRGNMISSCDFNSDLSRSCKFIYMGNISDLYFTYETIQEREKVLINDQNLLMHLPLVLCDHQLFAVANRITSSLKVYFLLFILGSASLCSYGLGMIVRMQKSNN